MHYPLLFLFFVDLCGCGVAAYTAAAVQHTPVDAATPASVIAKNYDQYESYTKTAVRSAADIVVFPEAGTGWCYAQGRAGMRDNFCEQFKADNGIACGNGSVPATSQRSRGSCLARDHNVYAVINTCDKVPCGMADPDCPSDGWYLYNTDVVFDQTGLVVAKYHKSHLFGESGIFRQPPQPDIVYFDTSFGVRFGLMICFDMEFAQPATSLIHSLRIQNIILSSDWVNWAPLQTATTTQQAFSRVWGVNLVAANIGSAPYSAGGGIYEAGKVLAQWFPTEAGMDNKVLIATLPSAPRRRLFTDTNHAAQHWRSMSSVDAKLPPLQQKLLPLQPTQPDYHEEPCVLGSWPPTSPLHGSCTMFYPADVARSATISLHAATPDGFTCHATLKFGGGLEGHQTANQSYVLVATNWTLPLKNTPTKSAYQICGIMPCFKSTTKSGGLQCNLNPYQGSYPSLPNLVHGTVYGEHFSTANTVNLPMIAGKGMQLLEPSQSKYYVGDGKFEVQVHGGSGVMGWAAYTVLNLSPP